MLFSGVPTVDNVAFATSPGFCVVVMFVVSLRGNVVFPSTSPEPDAVTSSDSLDPSVDEPSSLSTESPDPEVSSAEATVTFAASVCPTLGSSVTSED